MKKMSVSAAALLVLAGSAVSFSRPAAAAAKTASPAQHQMIPPPGCPVDDPNGCGILG